MIRRAHIFPALLLFAAALSACSSTLPIPAPVSVTPTGSHPTYWTLPLVATWQIQFTGALDTSLPMDIYNLDLFDTPPETIADLHTRGGKVMCYFGAGSYEDRRPDAEQFPASVLGNDLEGWPGERWLNIRNLQVLAPIMLERIALAAQKGCDGVDPDNVNGYANKTGFPLTAEDQIGYNIFLADSAHQHGLGISLKNDLDQIPSLASYFDWTQNESCFYI